MNDELFDDTSAEQIDALDALLTQLSRADSSGTSDPLFLALAQWAGDKDPAPILNPARQSSRRTRVNAAAPKQAVVNSEPAPINEEPAPVVSLPTPRRMSKLLLVPVGVAAAALVLGVALTNVGTPTPPPAPAPSASLPIEQMDVLTDILEDIRKSEVLAQEGEFESASRTLTSAGRRLAEVTPALKAQQGQEQAEKTIIEVLRLIEQVRQRYPEIELPPTVEVTVPVGTSSEATAPATQTPSETPSSSASPEGSANPGSSSAPGTETPKPTKSSTPSEVITITLGPLPGQVGPGVGPGTQTFAPGVEATTN